MIGIAYIMLAVVAIGLIITMFDFKKNDIKG